jgi:hypothetical protein
MGNGMAKIFTCPDGYTRTAKFQYKSNVELCVKKIFINNISVVSDITSDAESLKIGMPIIVCLIICIIILYR